MSSIAVCLVSLEERHDLLAEAIASVYAQTRRPDDLVVGVDYSRVGEVANNNRLLSATDSEWVAFLHDDDVWEPSHLATAETHFSSADVIVSDFTTPGRDTPQHFPKTDDWSRILTTNWFPPSAVVVRRSLFGKWTEPSQPPPRDWVDWSNWRRLYSLGARFTHTNKVTMQYRFGPWSNGSWRARG